MKHRKYRLIETVITENWEHRLQEVWKETERRVKIRNQGASGKAVRHLMRAVGKTTSWVVIEILGIIEVWRKRTDAIAFYSSLIVSEKMKESISKILYGLNAGERLI